MMTLKKLKERVPVADEEKVYLGKAELVNSGAEIVVKEIVKDGAELSVYDNGFVMYEEGLHKTIFRLHECNGYEYHGLDGKTEIFESDFFENERWYILLMIIGMDRMETNRKRLLTNHKVLSFNAEDTDFLSLRCPFVQDMTEELIQKEMIEEIVSLLNDRQFYAVTAYYCEGVSQDEIAKNLHISQQAASGLIKRTLAMIQNYMQVTPSDVKRQRNKK